MTAAHYSCLVTSSLAIYLNDNPPSALSALITANYQHELDN